MVRTTNCDYPTLAQSSPELMTSCVTLQSTQSSFYFQFSLHGPCPLINAATPLFTKPASPLHIHIIFHPLGHDVSLTSMTPPHSRSILPNRRGIPPHPFIHLRGIPPHPFRHLCGISPHPFIHIRPHTHCGISFP